jgi:hypothetical protein
VGESGPAMAPKGRVERRSEERRRARYLREEWLAFVLTLRKETKSANLWMMAGGVFFSKSLFFGAHPMRSHGL